MKSVPTVANEVRAWREDRGMTQVELAAAAGVSRQTIFHIEKKQHAPSVEVALRLSQALDANVEDLFTLSQP